MISARTVDEKEVEHFSRLAGEWWDERGPFAPLHRINALRIEWIQSQVTSHFPMIEGLTLLDIGCGGGLVCEKMAALGLHVTGIDASPENIEVAKLHARQSGLTIDYRSTTAEELVSSLRGATGDEAIQSGSLRFARDDGFDVVLALEIVEHVANVPAFVEASCKLLKPGGLVIYSTLNRTAKSFALGIVAAEYVLRWVPRGTHHWEKFLKPSELAAHLRASGVKISDMTGMVMNPLTMKWELNPRDLGVNYLLAAKK